MPSRTPFDILGISPEAEAEVIQAAYRTLARKYHPDTNPGVPPGKLNARMVELNWARAELERDLAGWRTRGRAHQPDSGKSKSQRRAREPQTAGEKYHAFRSIFRSRKTLGAVAAIATLGVVIVLGFSSVRAGPSTPDDLWSLCAKTGTSRELLTKPPITSAGYVFRCYDGRPLQCETGFTGAECFQLSSSQPPGLAAYCVENPDAKSPPYAVIGHEEKTMFWSCLGGKPIGLPNPGFNPSNFDELGFLRVAWEAMPPPSSR